MSETPRQVPHDVDGRGGEVCHGHPHVGGGLLGVHGLVHVAEQVGGVLGVGPRMHRLRPQLVVLVLCYVILTAWVKIFNYNMIFVESLYI